MELKDISCDKDISIELKEKGFKQESLFAWVPFYNTNTDIGKKGFAHRWELMSHSDCKNIISAPTAEEILKELPKRFIYKSKTMCYLRLDCSHEEYRIQYYYFEDNLEYALCLHKQDKKLCNALAKIWIYLKDNNLLEK